MNIIVIGNIVAFIGAILMVLVGFIKTKRNILIAQNIQFLIMGLGNLILGGVSGFIVNIVGILRNISCLRWNLNVPLKIFFIALQVIINWRFNTAGLIGWLPVVATGLFTWYVDSNSEIVIKTVCIISECMWIFYDFHFHNYVSVSFDVMTIVSTFVGIWMILRDRKNAKEAAGEAI